VRAPTERKKPVDRPSSVASGEEATSGYDDMGVRMWVSAIPGCSTAGEARCGRQGDWDGREMVISVLGGGFEQQVIDNRLV